MNPKHKLLRIIPSITRHILLRNSRPYDQILRHLGAQGDIWIVPQGEYMAWWIKRENAPLEITVSKGKCHIVTPLENAVIEKFPGEFLDSPTIACEGTKFSGQVFITLDSALEKKELLIEILKREGILNYRIAEQGKFMLSQSKVGPILEETDGKLEQLQVKSFEAGVHAIRQIVIDKLAAHNLPLLRIWYHPRINGIVAQAAFSPRFDVDRAITNLAHVRALEKKHDVSSTLYLRVSCPFYTDKAIKKLASATWCSEIALHGEFVTHARTHGDERTAAQAEKDHLEKLIGRPILGVAMHGGELSYNKSENTDDAIQKAGFLYDTSPWMRYYFPFKKTTDGQFGQSYNLPQSFSEISLLSFKPAKKIVNGQAHKSYSLTHVLSVIKTSPIRNYDQVAFEKTMARMDKVYRKNGVFVLALHPVYFGFFSYLFRPGNWIPLIKSLSRYFKPSSR